MLEQLSFEIPLDKIGRLVVKKINDEMFEEICSLTQFVKDTSRKSLSERIYCIKNNLTEIPKCPECGKDVIFFGSSFQTFCSLKCSNGAEQTKNKMKQTNFINHGDENYRNIEKMKLTKKEKYGDENYSNIEKMKLTKKEKYGDENYNNQEKMKQTKLETYGDPYYNNHEQTKQTKLETYGDENYTNREQAKQTNLVRHGSEHYVNTILFKQQSAETKLFNFGDPYFTNPDKMKQTKLKRYGDENYVNASQISISKAKHFQARRNAEGTDFHGVVYFLYFEHLKAVKIGLTGKQDGRFKKIERDFGPFKILNLIETEECNKLESFFHEKYDEFRKPQPKGGGKTEFFSDEILELLEFDDMVF